MTDGLERAVLQEVSKASWSRGAAALASSMRPLASEASSWDLSSASRASAASVAAPALRPAAKIGGVPMTTTTIRASAIQAGTCSPR